MTITVIGAGKLKEKYFRDAIEEYAKRLSRFVKLQIIEVPDEKIPENASEKQCAVVREKEGAQMLSRYNPASFCIALCVEGDTLSSEALAEKIAKASMHYSHITFFIGGSLGLSDAVKNASQLRLSFGRMTLPHQLMRVVLLEQIYRAYKINANENYHK